MTTTYGAAEQNPLTAAANAMLGDSSAAEVCERKMWCVVFLICDSLLQMTSLVATTFLLLLLLLFLFLFLVLVLKLFFVFFFALLVFFRFLFLLLFFFS